MDNNSIEKEPLFKRNYPPNKVIFTWEITYKCNYKCTYCHAKKPNDPATPATMDLKPEEWIGIWDRIHACYGKCDIIVSGGEPSVYPGFIKLAKGISEHHNIELTTNLSFDPAVLVHNMDPKKVRVRASFHPEHESLESFLEKVVLLKNNEFDLGVNIVPWPPFMKDIAAYKKAFDSSGIRIVLQIFNGEYKGKRYPGDYSPEDKKLLGICNDETNISMRKEKLEKHTEKKGKLCRMGQNYAFIHSNGVVYRCCKDKNLEVGNIADRNFKLWDEPKPCSTNDCCCYRAMLVEAEPKWVRDWNW